MTSFGRHPAESLRDLGRQACAAALRDAGVHPSAVEAVYCANALGLALQGESGIGQSVAWEVGVHSVPVVNVENACASGSTALHQAWRDIAGGFHDVVLVIGVEKSVMPKGSVLNVGMGELETQLGDVFPAMFAMIAQQHMRRYGTTREQMAAVSVKNHFNGSLNPFAQFQKQVTIDEVLASPMIADPLTLYSCCPNSDGAASVVLCSADRLAAARGRAIRVAASALTSGSYDSNRDLTRWESEARAARTAYEQSGFGPDDLDVVEVHDAFTISEIVHCETLGLCEPGEGGPMLEQGATALGGRIPVNPSGGLQARGHPPGASGLAQAFEIVTQLRGEAGARQAPGARVGLAQIMGGSKEGDARACTVHIFVRE